MSNDNFAVAHMSLYRRMKSDFEMILDMVALDVMRERPMFRAPMATGISSSVDYRRSPAVADRAARLYAARQDAAGFVATAGSAVLAASQFTRKVPFL
jgi:hypothetical protein